MRDYISYANDDLDARWNSKVEWAVDPRDGKFKWLLIALRSGAVTCCKAILMRLTLIHMTCLIGSS